jgi:hypothetical protein
MTVVRKPKYTHDHVFSSARLPVPINLIFFPINNTRDPSQGQIYATPAVSFAGLNLAHWQVRERESFRKEASDLELSEKYH